MSSFESSVQVACPFRASAARVAGCRARIQEVALNRFPSRSAVSIIRVTNAQIPRMPIPGSHEGREPADGLGLTHKAWFHPPVRAMPGPEVRRGVRGYYSERLAGERLRACYEVAPPRVRAYLEAEIEFVLRRIAPSMAVLELGCGYGRVLRRLVSKARAVVGIDTSLPSLRMALGFVGSPASVSLARMDAAALGFRDGRFDVTVCVQNGISALGVDPRRILTEAVRVTRPGGRVLVSSYLERFWEARLEWFEVQAARGLIGEIDRRATGNGVIVCQDGFRATSVDAATFRALAGDLGLVPAITEVDGSSLFFEVVIPR